MRTSLRRLALTIVATVAAACLLVAAFYLYEAYVLRFDPAASNFWWQYPREPLPISPQAVATRTSGTISSVYANLDYRGPSTWDARTGAPTIRTDHIRSSRYGFYTEYPVDEYPPKARNEFRIILFGGSGAQGHGASANEKMMYSLLERYLNVSLADTGARVRVINLALPGATALESSNALRAFGHGLDADLLLGYSGPNDVGQFPNHYFDTACGAHLANLLNSTFVAPGWMKAAASHFPALFYRAGLLSFLKRTFYTDDYRQQAEQQCLRDLKIDKAGVRGSAAAWRDGVVPMLIEQLQAIKRDFCGIPMVIAWAAASDWERAAWERVMDFHPDTNPAVLIKDFSKAHVSVQIFSPHRRIVRILALSPGSPKPNWEELMQSGSAHAKDASIVSMGIASTEGDTSPAPPAVFYAFEDAGGLRTVYQAPSEPDLYRNLRERGIYRRTFELGRDALRNYFNDDWYFMDIDRDVQGIDPQSVPGLTSRSIQVHLDDVGQKVVADAMSRRLSPIVRNLLARSDRPGCPRTVAAGPPIVTQSLSKH